MEKTLDESFRDWEATAFGFGYGSGEPHLVPALKAFFAAIGERAFDYRALEEAVGPVPAWLLINTLCRLGVIDYGTSPRFGWLTDRGLALKAYLGAKSVEELLAALVGGEEDVICYPDACNCGEFGYEEGRVCRNPFWGT